MPDTSPAELPDAAETPAARRDRLVAAARDARRARRHADALALVEAAIALAPDNPGLRLDRAGDLAACDRLDDAEQAFRAVLPDLKDPVQAHLGLGRIARRRGDREAALAHHRDAVAATPANGWPHLEASADLLALGRLDEAEAAARAAMVLKDTSFDAHLALGRVARRRGDRHTALVRHRDAAATRPDKVWGHVEAANDLLALDRPADAEAACRAALAVDPGEFHAVVGLARIARKRNDREAAIALLRDGADRSPRNPWFRLELGADLAALHRDEEAEEAYWEAASLDATLVEARLGLARCARRRGDREASLAILREAGRLAPRNPHARIEAGADLLALGRLAEAEAAYRAALAIDPALLEPRLGLGRCANAAGEPGAALSIHRAAIAASPGSMAAHLAAAADLRALGRLDEAEAAARDALAVSGAGAGTGRPEPFLALAAVARLRGDREAALVHATAAHDAASGAPWGLLEMAGEHRALGRPADAIACYERARTLDPANLHACIGLGHCARATGDREAALAWFERARAAAPHSPAPLLELGVEHREMGRIDEARAALDRALALEPANLHAHLERAAVERSLGRHAETFAILEALHRLHPTRAQPLLEMAAEQRSLGNPAAAGRLLARARAAEPASPVLAARLAEHAMMEGDPEAALALHEQAIAARPHDAAHRLAAIDALVTLGRVDEAFARLDALEAAHPGTATATQAALKRVSLLRRIGETVAALDGARALAAAEPADAQAAAERVTVEMLVGTEPDIDAALAALPARTPRERSRHARLQARVDEERVALDAALAGYRRAEALDARSGEIQQDLARLAVWSFDLARLRAHLVRFSKAIEPSARLRGRSSNVTQSHYGQILDEFELDRPTVDRLRALLARPAADRIAPILDLVRDNPDSTAAAIALAAALRETPGIVGLPDASPAPARVAARAATPIPRVIAQYWDDPEPPADIVGLTATWRAQNPGWRHRICDDAAARAFLRDAHGLSALAAYGLLAEPARRADLFRLAWLAAEGGLYVDADDRCLAPIDALVPPHATLVAYQEDIATLANNFLAAAPRHPVILRALEGAIASALRGDRDIVWLSTGPGLLTRAFAADLATAGASWRDRLANTVILKRRELFRVASVHCHTGYKRTAFHWSNTAFAGRRPRATAA